MEKNNNLVIFQSAGGINPSYTKVENIPEFKKKEEARTWIAQQVDMGALSGDNSYVVMQPVDLVVFSKKVEYTLQGKPATDGTKQIDETFLDPSFKPVRPNPNAAPQVPNRKGGGRGMGSRPTK